MVPWKNSLMLVARILFPLCLSKLILLRLKRDLVVTHLLHFCFCWRTRSPLLGVTMKCQGSYWRYLRNLEKTTPHIISCVILLDKVNNPEKAFFFLQILSRTRWEVPVVMSSGLYKYTGKSSKILKHIQVTNFCFLPWVCLAPKIYLYFHQLNI